MWESSWIDAWKPSVRHPLSNDWESLETIWLIFGNSKGSREDLKYLWSYLPQKQGAPKIVNEFYSLRTSGIKGLHRIWYLRELQISSLKRPYLRWATPTRI